MQKLFYLLLFLVMGFSASAQLNVLFVNDSGDAFDNGEYVASALDSLGYDYVFFDAYAQNVSPTLAEMNDYDLVIWYTSTWGLSLQLWNGGDSTNIELQAYLAQPNANLWLVGLDYLYDRYGGAPVSFQSGDFAYDHLGISKYAVQSYADDNAAGVPLVTPVSGQPIPGLTDLDWQFSTLWYADGFELRPEATPIYLFGGSGYALSGTPTAVWYHPDGEARVLTYGFDLAQTSNFNLLRSNVASVLTWWNAELTATHAPMSDIASVKIAPNSFDDRLEIRVQTLQATSLSVRIYSADGQLITQISNAEIIHPETEKVLYWNAAANLPDGIYYCTVQSDWQVQTVKLVKQHR